MSSLWLFIGWLFLLSKISGKSWVADPGHLTSEQRIRIQPSRKTGSGSDPRKTSRDLIGIRHNEIFPQPFYLDIWYRYFLLTIFFIRIRNPVEKIKIFCCIKGFPYWQHLISVSFIKYFLSLLVEFLYVLVCMFLNVTPSTLLWPVAYNMALFYGHFVFV